MENSKKHVKWLKVCGEGLVIVASILMAFAIDAWWAERSQQTYRTALISALVEDFVALEAELKRVGDVHTRANSAAAQLIAMAQNTALDAKTNQNEIDALASDLLDGATFFAPLGSVNALLANGKLDLVNNKDLLRELTAWPSMVDNLLDDQKYDLNHVKEALLPYLRANNIATHHLVWNKTAMDVPWQKQHTQTYLLLRHSEFLSLVSDRWFASEFSLISVRKAQKSLERIQALLKAEIALLAH